MSVASDPKIVIGYWATEGGIVDAALLIPIVTTGAVTVTAPGIALVSFSPTGSGRFWTLHPDGIKREIGPLLN